MTTCRIVLKMEGPAANGNHLELSVFSKKVEQLHNLLNSIIKSDAHEKVVMSIVGLSHSSPATVECTAYLNGEPYPAPAQALLDNLTLVNEEGASHISHPFLSALEQLAEADDKKIACTEIEIRDIQDIHVFPFDDQFRDKLGKARSAESVETSTIEGKLDEINIHKQPYTFKVYTWSPAVATVQCKFSSELLEQVHGALGKWVSVSGQCFARPGAVMPYKIEVQEIEVWPPSEQLPSLQELRGVAPGLTGEKMPEEFIRELRDQWDRR